MNCRHCNEVLEDGVTVCPACGGDNAQPRKRDWKPIVAVICCVALVLGFVACWFVMNRFPDTQTEEITIKSSYSVSDDEAVSNADVVVAKAGDFTLTNEELQIIYWTMFYDFLDYYGDYAYYILDVTAPLDQQYYNEEAGITWQHYFLDLALQSWRRYEVLTAEAKAAGVEMTADRQASLDGLYDAMEAGLANVGMDSVEEMVYHDFGAAGTFDAYKDYMTIYTHGNQYFNQLIDEMNITDEQIEAYYAENETDFISAGYGKDAGNTVDVRHVLIQPNDDQSATDYTDAEWAACLEEAQGLLDQWVNDGATEEDFIQMAIDHSADGNAADGGLYTGITSTTNFVEPFLNWCMDESRQSGDYGLVQTNYGYHIMYFVDSYELWYEVALSNLTSEQAYNDLTTMEQEYPMVIVYSKIMLGVVDMGY